MILPSLLVTLALLLASPVQAGGPRALPAGAPAGIDDEVALTNRFFDAGHSYCDARVLARHWGQELWETKVRAGRTLARNGAARLRVDLGAAQARVGSGQLPPCDFYDTGVEVAQAAALAALWGVSTMEAKAKVAWAASTGARDSITTALAQASTAADSEGLAGQAEEEAHISAFLRQDTYDHCHAKMISALWGNDVRQAKASIGYKLTMGWNDSLQMLIDSARQNARSTPAARCTFVDLPYLPDDATALATLWGVSTADAKARLEQKYLDGTESLIPEELVRAGRR